MKGIRLEMLYQVQVRDRDGKVVRDSGLRRSRSYVSNFLGIIGSFMEGANLGGIKDTTGTARTTSLSAMSTYIIMGTSYDAGSGNRHADGLVVGTGTTAVAQGDYALAALILDGAVANKLSYGVMSYVNPAIEGDYQVFKQSRIFTNNSGAAITIKEIGLYAQTKCTDAGAWRFMHIRDLLSSPYTVAAGGTVTVQYVMRTKP